MTSITAPFANTQALTGRPTGNSASGDQPHFHLFGVRVANATMEEALDDLATQISSGRKTRVAFVNADCMNKCFSDGDYHLSLRRMERVYADGIGVRIAARFFANRVRDNVNGTDMFPLLCERLVRDGRSLYLLGAREGIAAQVADNMRAAHPGLKIAGTRNGYFDADQEDEVISEINTSGADVLLVAFGAPGQELWIDRNFPRLRAKVLMGVGGLFDFYSGRIERAPQWMRSTGLEWVWRLLQEPGRMRRRYVLGNPLFLHRVWAQRRRNGAVARALQVAPAQEADVLENFSDSASAHSLRVALINFGHYARRGVRTGGNALKRLLDVVVSAGMLFVLSPLFALVIAAIRLESPGKAFYSQMRVGYRGTEFRLWKFRSMYRDAEARRAELEAANEMAGGVIFKMKHDPRITRVGRIIRKLSIDELPQLWNVLKGDMSLVGPRPALASEVAQYSIEERVRLLSRPGLTCFWQVGGRSDIPFDQQVRLDEDYLYQSSFLTDVKLLFKTIPAVLFGRGAY